MIKIQINNLQDTKKEFINSIAHLVANRIKILQASLSHLNGESIDFNSAPVTSFKAITKDIVKITGGSINIQNGQQEYIKAIQDYIGKNNNLMTINIKSLINFCKDLLADNNKKLAKLLTCEPSKLIFLNNKIIHDYDLNSNNHLAIIKLAFDYKRFEKNISSKIRKYFIEKKFVEICPYCNTKKAHQKTNSSKEIVESFQLDHFYDKAKFPLLSYSLFNLIPSDQTCNAINKKDILFTDEYHLNPYLSGYTESINFEPIGLNTSYEVNKIQLNISENKKTDLYKKINGTNEPLVEKGKEGNLNVFKIRSKHDDQQYLASRILKTLNATYSNINHINKYLKILTRNLKIEDSYVQWYEKEFNVRFLPSNFNDKAYSKFCRDIHDYYYSNNKKIRNPHIIELPKNS
ncbi:hypothetical protein NWE55_02070 [Myroides albus]|uniref:hypothetical protein n=1 Tax=Myroides albus TaxID=2562892 RepID=UPI002158E5D1|nr:hypothetical protein [Myroides albus]UVD80101.1 hypothetical protein NWE55_02070 [Myroides albus]